MSLNTLLFGILPLIIFVVIDSFAGLKAGIISALFFAFLEVTYTLVVYKKIDEITLGSLFVIFIFGFLSYRSGDSFYFKIQPVVLGILFALSFLIMQWMGKPLLLILMKKYQYIMPENMRIQINNPAYQHFLAKASYVLGWGFLIHAGLVGYSALYLSNWWWLAMRGIGVYVMMFLSLAITRFL